MNQSCCSGWLDTPKAGREVLIELACDADYQQLSNGWSYAGSITIAQALEVLK